MAIAGGRNLLREKTNRTWLTVFMILIAIGIAGFAAFAAAIPTAEAAGEPEARGQRHSFADPDSPIEAKDHPRPCKSEPKGHSNTLHARSMRRSECSPHVGEVTTAPDTTETKVPETSFDCCEDVVVTASQPEKENSATVEEPGDGSLIPHGEDGAEGGTDQCAQRECGLHKCGPKHSCAHSNLEGKTFVTSDGPAPPSLVDLSKPPLLPAEGIDSSSAHGLLTNESLTDVEVPDRVEVFKETLPPPEALATIDGAERLPVGSSVREELAAHTDGIGEGPPVGAEYPPTPDDRSVRTRELQPSEQAASLDPGIGSGSAKRALGDSSGPEPNLRDSSGTADGRALAPDGIDRTIPAAVNGDGLFTPSTFPDAILAISVGLAAVMGIWYWLSQQRRRDDGLAQVLTGGHDGGLDGFRAGASVANSEPSSAEPVETAEAAKAGGPLDEAPPTNGALHKGNSATSPINADAIPAAYLAGTIATAVRLPSINPQGNGHPVEGSQMHSPLPAAVVPASSRHGVVPPKFRAPTQARVSVVIPAKNEETSLPYVLRRLPPWLHEVIVVDGLSKDATSEVARLCLPSVRVVSQTGRGKGNALREGFVHSTGDIVVALDADGSMDPEEIPAIVAFLESGFDYVKASRMIGGGSSVDLTRFRRFGNWMFRTLTNFLHGTSYTDLCYGYFGFRRGTVDRLDLRSSGFEIETEISIKAHHAGLRTAEIPSSESARHNGASNLSAFRDGWQILRTIVQAAAEDSVPAHSHLGAVAIIGLGLGALIALGAILLPQGATNVAGMDAIPAAGPAPPAAAALLPITINPVDDAYVAGELPNDNFGSDPSLEADASPVRESYLKFDLRALASQGVSQATLRMYVTNGSGGAFDLRNVADSAWTEGAITFNNKPAKGTSSPALPLERRPAGGSTWTSLRPPPARPAPSCLWRSRPRVQMP